MFVVIVSSLKSEPLNSNKGLDKKCYWDLCEKKWLLGGQISEIEEFPWHGIPPLKGSEQFLVWNLDQNLVELWFLHSDHEDQTELAWTENKIYFV